MKAHTAALILVLLTLSLSACGGGGDSSSHSTERPVLEPNSILLSDMLVSFQDEHFRIEDLHCLPDLSRCQATFQGDEISFTPEHDADIDANIYETLGEWEHMEVVAVFGRLQGMQARYAAAAGVTYPNSIPRGPATWSGHMVGLDSNNRVVRGAAIVQLIDFADEEVDVWLTPESYPVEHWRNVPLRGGVYSERRRASRNRDAYHYIKGEFYGPNAEETGGVFEINRRSYGLIGAFGSSRDSE